MERSTLEQHLREAQGHAAEGKERIATQRRIIRGLEQGRHDTALARELLETFEKLQATHAAEIDRLTRELARDAGFVPSWR